MRHEKIFKREDGTQVNVLVTLVVESYRNEHKYRVDVEYRPKGKKKWLPTTNSDDYTWRALNFEARERHNFYLYLEYTTEQEIQEVALELWEQLKPKFI